MFTFSILFRLKPFLESDFRPYSWDGLSIVYGAQSLIEKGKFVPDTIQQSGYSPIEYSRRKAYYPISQIFLALSYKIISFFGKIEYYNLIVYLSLLLYILLLIVAFFVEIEITENLNLSTLGVFFIAMSPALTRDLTWCTLFSLKGYLIVFFSLFCLAKYFKMGKNVWLLLFFILSFLVLPLVHMLTSVILIFSFFLMILITNLLDLLKNKKISKLIYLFILISAIFAALLIFSQILINYPETQNLNVFEKIIFLLYLGSSYYMHDRFVRNTRNILDVPLLTGYLHFVLGIYGLFYIRPKEIKYLLFSILFLATILGTGYLIGFNYYGERPIIYTFIPISLAAPVGFSMFTKHLKYICKKRNKIYYFIIAIILFSIIQNSFSYQENFYYSWKPSLPSKYDLEAIEWLNKNALKNYTILTVHYWPYVSTKWIPILTGMNTTFLQIESIASYEYYEIPTYTPRGFIAFLISKFVNENVKLSFKEFVIHTFNIGFDQLGYETFLMFKYPESNESKRLFKYYRIKYVYVYNGLPEDRTIGSASNFKLIWSNNVVNIYEINEDH